MENTPFAKLYKWNQTDTKQETIVQMANNSDKIDQNLSEQHERLNVIDEKATDALNKANAAKTEAEIIQGDFNRVVAEAGSNNPEVVQARGTEVNLNARLNKTETQLADKSLVPLENESAPLGAELVASSGWVANGWTGDFSAGFKHTVGQTTPLTFPLGAIAGKLYQVTLTIEDTDTMNSGFNFNVTVGGSVPFEMYQGTGATITYSRGIQSVSGGDLTIIPTSSFTGTIKNISVKEITGIIPPNLTMKDSTENNVFELRPTKADLFNLFFGKNAGSRNTSGNQNTVVGQDAAPNNTSGFWNSVLGYQALYKNTVGSRSIAIGRFSLYEQISGHRNIAVGTFALHRVTTGANNIGIGADSAWHTTTGVANIAIGTVSLDANTTGSGNIAIGYNALRDNETTSYNVGIGYHTLRENKSHNNTAVGTRAATSTTTGGGTTAIGYEALKANTTGLNNTAVGQWAAAVLSSGAGNTLMGRMAAGSLTSGSNNVILGVGSGTNLVNGSSNILIGFDVTTPSATQSNYLNIGNKIFGDMANELFAIGNNQPTNDSLAYTGIKLEIGRADKMGNLTTSFGSNVHDAPVGSYGFVNKNNLDTSATTRKTIAYIQGLVDTDNANVNGDSGGALGLFTKIKGGSYAKRMHIGNTGSWLNSRLTIGAQSIDDFAWLRLGTGTSTIAPIKFNNGALLSTATVGCMEYDGTNLYFTTSTGVRQKVQLVAV